MRHSKLVALKSSINPVPMPKDTNPAAATCSSPPFIPFLTAPQIKTVNTHESAYSTPHADEFEKPFTSPITSPVTAADTIAAIIKIPKTFIFILSRLKAIL